MRKWALVSVYKKDGIVPFCQQLVEAGYGILSTGGTATHLQNAGIEVTEVEDYTGFPEMMNGRVKTLHPKVHGGILSLRNDAGHVDSMETYGIDAIDLVVVNLYPFEETIAKPDVTVPQAIEMIDIGGPSMLRSAAKNHTYCIPVVDPSDYAWIGEALTSGKGVSEAERRALAAKVFATTSAYDAAISNYLNELVTLEQAGADASTAVGNIAAGEGHLSGAEGNSVEAPEWPNRFELTFVKKQALRYGENPHQAAQFYAEPNASSATIAGATQFQGKELSYNNIQDADAAVNILRNLDDLNSPACVAVKHMNPCGVGLGDSSFEAFERAFDADPVSIFGGILAFNRIVDADVAEPLTKMFLEIIIAPEFTDEARALFAKKKNLRLLQIDMSKPLWRPGDVSFRRVSGGLLVQQVDIAPTPEFTVVTKRTPTPEEWTALKFGWRIVQFVKSNAIVLSTAEQTVGIGAGQMNRVGAAKIAIEQAGAKTSQAILASDAFFPMRDTVETAAAAGIRAIIQPGGSIKDAESIEAADEFGIAMVFTGQRHFLH